MKLMLHILTRPADGLVAALIDPTLPATAGVRVEVIDLSVGDPDYGALVEKVFAADAVATW